MEDINSQQNIHEFSVQAFRKVCDALVLSPPRAVTEADDPDEKRYLILRELRHKVLDYAGVQPGSDEPAERPGQFLQTYELIEALGKYWRVHSMNLETIINEFVFNVLRRG